HAIPTKYPAAIAASSRAKRVEVRPPACSARNGPRSQSGKPWRLAGTCVDGRAAAPTATSTLAASIKASPAAAPSADSLALNALLHVRGVGELAEQPGDDE